MKTANNKGMDVIFCGLLREPERFKKSLQDMKQLQKEGIIKEIIWSTWNGKSEKISGIKILESIEPGKIEGHMWHQMKSLDAGLQYSQSEDVLKTRTDVYINPDFLRQLKNNCKNKIWVPWYQRLYPFYMADECFYGKHEDIQKLVNYCEDYDNKYKISVGGGHVRRFAHAFAHDEIRKYMDGKMDGDEWVRYYYKILRDKFYVHPGGIVFRWWSGKNVKKEIKAKKILLEFCCDIKLIEHEFTENF